MAAASVRGQNRRQKGDSRILKSDGDCPCEIERIRPAHLCITCVLHLILHRQVRPRYKELALELKNGTVLIPNEFRGVTLSIWQKILLWLGRPIFVTLKSGKVCIVFIEDDRLKFKCGNRSVDDARKAWKERAAPESDSIDEDEDEDDGGGGGSGGGSGGGGGGNSGDVPSVGVPRPILTPRPSPNPRPKPKPNPPEEEKKKKKKEEPEPAPVPSVEPEEPGDDPFIDEPDEIVPLPTETPEPVPDVPVTRPSRRRPR